MNPITNIRTEVTNLIIAVVVGKAQSIPRESCDVDQSGTAYSRMVLANGTLIEFPTRVWCELIEVA